MSSVGDAPMAELVRDADPATVTAFVADLYAARGWTVDRHGDRQLVVSDGERTTKIAVVHPADHGRVADLVEWADRIVAPDGSETLSGEADVLDAATLGQQLAYALDRPVARQLLLDHFDWAPDPTDDRTGADSRPDGTDDTPELPGPLGTGPLEEWLPGPVGGRSGVLLAGLVVLAVAGGVTIVVADQLRGEESTEMTTGRTAPNLSVVATATPTTGNGTPAIDADRVTPPEREARETFANLPPGVNQSGGIDLELLTDAHETALVNTSYRITITYRESVDGRPTGVYTETIRVANASRYRVDVSRRGRLQAPIPSIAETDVYADGNVRYERIGESVVREDVVVSYDRFALSHTRLLAVFLDVRESSIVDYQSDNESATVYVVTEGNPATLITNTTGSFAARSDGLVSRGHWSYGFSPQLTHYAGVQATFSIRITDVGSTTVRKPEWVPETTPTPTPTPTPVAENATGG